MKTTVVLLGVVCAVIGGGLTQLTHSQQLTEPTDLKSLAEMYNSEKFKWLPLQPGTERFSVKQGPFPNFEIASLPAEQLAVFLDIPATVLENGVKVRTLYVWESNADRHTYVYDESGEILASYPPPEGYDPYVLSRERIEGEPNLTQEKREWLIESLDPSRVVLSARVAEGPIPIAPPIFQPQVSGEAPLPGGFGTLGFDPQGAEPLSRTVATWLEDEAPLGLTLKFENPGKGSYIPIWRRSGPEFTADYAFWTQLENVASDSAEQYHQKSWGLRSRYYYAPFLDTTYVQAPSSDSVTVKYVAARNVTPTVYLWKAGAWGGKANKNATKVELAEGSGIWVYEATFTEEDFQGKVPDHVVADAVYKYIFGWTEGGSDQHTAVQTTRTWPVQEDITDFSFVVYGDNRGDDNNNFQSLHRDVVCLGIMNRGIMQDADYPAFVLQVGDLVYEGGDALQWIPHFFRPAGALLGGVPVFPCIGNHDWEPGGAGVAKYTAAFTLPGGNERWYSFAYGNSYFIVLDTYSAFSSGSQYNWLVNTALPAAQGYDWVFALFHCPPYTDCSSHDYNDDDVQEVREDLAEPIFENEDGNPLDSVNVVFCGHSHVYERSYRRSVQYVVTGGGGAGLHQPEGGNPHRFHGESVRHHCSVHVFPNDVDDPVVTAHRNDGSVIESVLLPAGGRWRRYSEGQEPPDIGGFSWRDPAYDDSAWSYGPAELGYSDGEEQDEATILPYGGDPNNRWIAYYFRKRFYVAKPEAFDTLKLRLLRDDGAVVYINGEEVVRSNMPGTPGQPVPYATLASSEVEGAWPDPPNDEIDISNAPLNTGWNYAAVQVHQVSASSSDVSFDLEVVGRKPQE